MSFIKTLIKDASYQYPFRFLSHNVSTGEEIVVDLTRVPGVVGQIPTPLNATLLNAIEDELGALGTASKANTGILAGNVPVLDVGGKLPDSVLPALAINNTTVVASQTEMLALVAEPGDLAIRTDQDKNYILAASPASTLANWIALRVPAGAVTSVCGKTGVVTLAPTDLDAITASMAVVTNASGKMVASSTTVAEIGYVHGLTSAVQTQLNGKLGPSGAAANLTTAFTVAATRAVIATGETLAVSLGKILKYMTDFGAAAYSGVQNVLTSTSTTDVLSAAQGKALQDNKAALVGATFTGTVTVPAGTDYTTYRVRNMSLKTTSETPANGDILGVYS